eukprot:2528540-Pleurochrysis_carterae.AAC.3
MGESGIRIGAWSDLWATVTWDVADGRPGGWSPPASCTAVAIGVVVVVGEGFQGNTFSSKYTSDVSTTRGTLGTKTLYAPGVVRLRPKFTPTQARGSMRALE